MDRHLPPSPEPAEPAEVWRARRAERRFGRLGWILASVLLLLLVALLIGYSVSRMDQRPPQITVTPNSGEPGTMITVVGTNWPTNQPVRVGLSVAQPPATDIFILASLESVVSDWSVRVPIPETAPWRDLPLFNVVAFTPDRRVSVSQPFSQPTVRGAAAVTPAIVVVVGATPTPPPAPVIVVPAPSAVLATSTPSSGPAVGVIVASQETIGRPRRLLGPVALVDPANRLVDVALTRELAVRAQLPVSLPIATAAGQPLTLDSVPIGSQVDIQGLDNGKGLIIAERFVVLSLPGQVAAAPGVAVPATFSGWRGEYFPNQTLSGAPAIVRDDPQLNLNWGAQSPGPGLQGDDFSARWTRTVTLAAGHYRFRATGDGGVRVWLDGWPVLDTWRDTPGVWMGDVMSVQAGPHIIQVEYFNSGGNASLQVGWDVFEGYPEWRGEYYANATAEGAPTLLRNDPDLNFNWGDAAPAQGLPADGFAARWTRSMPFEAGDYRFRAQANGGLRLWIDETLILDAWQGGTNSPTRDFRDLTAGPHRVRVEYVNANGPASLVVRWEKLP